MFGIIESIILFVEAYNLEIIISICFALLLIIILSIAALVRISKMKRNYNELVRGADGINIEELLIHKERDMDKLRGEVMELAQGMKILDTKMTFSIQKVGLIRYNAFSDISSELSFSIAFLDEFLNGFVLTSIYGRDQSTCYAKSIKNGKSVYPLSAEEIQAIDRAIKGEL